MFNHQLLRWLFVGSVLCGISGLAEAKLSVPSFFSNGMVLQQEEGAKLWGMGNPHSQVKVVFADKTSEVTVGEDGKWLIKFDGLKANAHPQKLTISNDGDQLLIENVLVGEVWLASGQSNMEWLVSGTHSAAEARTHRDGLLRVFVSDNVATPDPQTNFKGTWATTRPGNTELFTAVGYQFGKELRAELGVPVGIIECAWGGKPVEAFISEQALADLPEAKEIIAAKLGQVSAYELAMKNRATLQANYQKELAQWQESKVGQRPAAPAMSEELSDPRANPNLHSSIYNGMIAPLAGYGMRGAIWYQGESNANNRGTKASQYAKYQACMINDWRARWGADFSFYYVQLANFNNPPMKSGMPSFWATVQDQQRQVLNMVKGTGMAVINDIGQSDNIHPKNKAEVGKRLARWALHHDYGKKMLVTSGPLYKGYEIIGREVKLSFDYAVGLKSRDGEPLKRFEVAGQNGVWHWAEARIDGQNVLVSSSEVARPTKVRYAWADNPEGANLVNAAGLPASCFSTK